MVYTIYFSIFIVIWGMVYYCFTHIIHPFMEPTKSPGLSLEALTSVYAQDRGYVSSDCPQTDRSSEGIDSTEQCQKRGCFHGWVGLNYQKARMDGDYHIISNAIHYVNTMNQQPTMMRDCPCHLIFDIAETQSCQDHDFGSKLFEMLCLTQDLWNMLDPSPGGYEGTVWSSLV